MFFNNTKSQRQYQRHFRLKHAQKQTISNVNGNIHYRLDKFNNSSANDFRCVKTAPNLSQNVNDPLQTSPSSFFCLHGHILGEEHHVSSDISAQSHLG